jgi:hypothetical protein
VIVFSGFIVTNKCPESVMHITKSQSPDAKINVHINLGVSLHKNPVVLSATTIEKNQA